MSDSKSELCEHCENQVEPKIVDYYGNDVPACPDCEVLL